MPTRKITERERLTLYARQATEDQLVEALEILNIEMRIRKGSKGGPAPVKKAARKPTAEKVPGPPNPPKPANDNPQG